MPKVSKTVGSFFRFRPRKGRFRDLNIIYEIFGKNFGQNFVKKGQNWWKSAFWPNFFYLMIKTPEKHCACKIWAFYHFSLPPKWTFLSCVFTKIEKNGSKLGQKGVKTGEKGRLELKSLNTWLESLEKMLHAKFQLFITFGYQKNENFYPDFLRKSIFSKFWLFEIEKFTERSFFKISSWNSRFG